MVIEFLLGLQGGHIKFPCALCLRDIRSRAQHWIKQGWRMKEEMVPDVKNSSSSSFVKICKCFSSPSYQGDYHEMKRFVKTLK